MTDQANEADDANTGALTADGRRALVQLVVRGMSRSEVTPTQQSLLDAGLASARGTILMPTQPGVTLAGQLTRLPEGGEEEVAITELFRRFLPINRALRQLCTDWQCRSDGSPNDHTDPVYDAAVRDRLDDIHQSIDRVLRRLSDVEPGLAHYRDELLAAMGRLDDGDLSALTSPLSESYHNVWMWLHQELLLMLGVSRAEDEALEEQLVSAGNQ